MLARVRRLAVAGSLAGLFCLVAGCGDNRRLFDAAVRDSSSDVPYVELPLTSEYNHASETIVAVSGQDVVVLSVHQRFPHADSFEFPTTLDPNNPFRRIEYTTSHDRGETFSPTLPLSLQDRGDPVVAGAGDGSFWAVGTDPFGSGTDMFRSSDGGETFAHMTTVAIDDKPWMTVDDSRGAIWIAGYSNYAYVGFDGASRGTAAGAPGMSAAFVDAKGVHFITYDSFQPITWDGLAPPALDGDALPAGEQANEWTFSAVSAGKTSSGATWIVRALHDSSGSPISVHVRAASGDKSEQVISSPGTVGFLPAAALDDQGRLHVVWYDSAGASGRLMYAHSLSDSPTGPYSDPLVIDSNACPGANWYPYASSTQPFGGRRLREYIGIGIAGNRAIISWTHAPDPPSRVRIAHVDF